MSATRGGLLRAGASRTTAAGVWLLAFGAVGAWSGCAADILDGFDVKKPDTVDPNRIDPNRVDDDPDDPDDPVDPIDDPVDPVDPVETPDTCQTGAVMGRLCLPGESDPLAGATVTVNAVDCLGHAVSFSDTSSAHGQFAFGSLPEGEQTFLVTQGTYSGSFTAEVVAGEIRVIGTSLPDEPLCLDQNPTRVAVITGDFDEVQNVLGGLDLSFDVYGHEAETEEGSPALVFLSDFVAMQEYDVIFFNCADNPDFFGYQSPTYDFTTEVYDNLRLFVVHGGSVYASDWAWPIAEALDPDAIDWHGDEATKRWDVQIGGNSALAGALVDEGLKLFLATPVVAIEYDLQGWAVIDGVGPNTDVFVTGDVKLNVDPVVTLQDKPLLVRFQPPDSAGVVLFTNFHYHSQPSAEMVDILRYMVFQL